MDVTGLSENEQRARWNGVAGRAWVEAQEVLDQLLKPLEDLLVGDLTAGSDRAVLDVGCGTGSTTLAAARRLGAQGRALGVDISEPMIAHARDRAAQERSAATFICADAQRHGFEAASFDTIMSRLGVMFFDDPVQAFANLRSAANEKARLRFIAWRSAAENPFMTTAERAAAPLLPNLPPRKPEGPGQFAFGDKQRVSTILHESGWTAIDIQPIDVPSTMPEKELVGYLTRLGPVGLTLPEVDEPTRAKVIETIRAAFEPFVHGEDVRFTSACWMVTARAAAAGRP